MKRTPLRRVSPRQQKRLNSYYAAADIYMDEHPMCEVRMCRHHADEIHHKMGRGIHIDNPDYFMSICRQCHRRVEDNKTWAREKGYILY
jgi:hypothetical protein